MGSATAVWGTRHVQKTTSITAESLREAIMIRLPSCRFPLGLELCITVHGNWFVCLPTTGRHLTPVCKPRRRQDGCSLACVEHSVAALSHDSSASVSSGISRQVPDQVEGYCTAPEPGWHHRY